MVLDGLKDGLFMPVGAMLARKFMMAKNLLVGGVLVAEGLVDGVVLKGGLEDGDHVRRLHGLLLKLRRWMSEFRLEFRLELLKLRQLR